LCMLGSGNGASKWAEMLFGHVWGGPVMGTTNKSCKRNQGIQHTGWPFPIWLPNYTAHLSQKWHTGFRKGWN